MVKRSLSFWGKYGPVVHSEPTFEGGYSSVVNTGDGDYVTKDTLWDFKVSKSAPTSKHTLQILMYYVMGLHSVHDFFKDIVNLGFFNPRLNAVYICPVSSISKDTIREIEDNVICYNIANSVSISQNSFLNIPRTHTPSIDYYSVADISQATGQKKCRICRYSCRQIECNQKRKQVYHTPTRISSLCRTYRNTTKNNAYPVTCFRCYSDYSPSHLFQEFALRAPQIFNVRAEQRGTFSSV